MNRHILFIQGGGEGGYEADKDLVAPLQTELGKGFGISYPEIKSDESAADFGWLHQIGEQISKTPGDIILAGHSFGASMILKFLSENAVAKKIDGIFLLATPFWNGEDDWQAGLKLPENFAERIDAAIPIFFYHCRDDEEISFSHLGQYEQKLSRAVFRKIEKGGHQFSSGLTLVANDIKTLNQH